MKKVAVILSGCGVFDGAEIHEATLTLLVLMKHNIEYHVFAPDIDQYHVINHLTGEVMQEKRNVLVEAARIARGNIQPLSKYIAQDFDALILPGGFGVAKNFSTYAFDGAYCKVHKEVENAIVSTNKAGKPIGALCIAPVVIAKLIHGVDVTIGQDERAINAIEAMGGHHIRTFPMDVIIDKKHKIVTSPCYMLDSTILQIYEGVENVIKAMLALK